ncbi:hypothetical protein M409DRAFT_49078 [Zasmidium cellare ATCC 36951]|uniref:Uncharacterized protein n=1 Tax=Zasmidium cellare ATCC 36951 TaxID=1080233 RepID=A0A6A6D7R2_ZASCE|nr:uncharacterized protein M409DRAFT_49078 [Zasmidium cellare ATCC 36951]KAF2174219.1 hypothetical protein M409DRAFT_49078 [Zasmidium cellare ATCC 36951]
MADSSRPAPPPINGKDTLFDTNIEKVFVSIIHAKQFLKRANNEQLNVYLSNAVQRIDVPHRAEKADWLLQKSNSFIDGKLSETDEKGRRGICNRMAAVSLLLVRQAAKKGAVSDLGIDWDVVKSMFDDEVHREILDHEGNHRPSEIVGATV